MKKTKATLVVLSLAITIAMIGGAVDLIRNPQQTTLLENSPYALDKGIAYSNLALKPDDRNSPGLSFMAIFAQMRLFIIPPSFPNTNCPSMVYNGKSPKEFDEFKIGLANQD